MQVNILAVLPLTHFCLETHKRVTGKQCELNRHLGDSSTTILWIGLVSFYYNYIP